MVRVWQWSPAPERIVQDIERWPAHIKRVIEAKGAKVPRKKKAGKRAREFLPPPDCPLTTAMWRAKFRELDNETLPPKKRARAT